MWPCGIGLAALALRHWPSIGPALARHFGTWMHMDEWMNMDEHGVLPAADINKKRAESQGGTSRNDHCVGCCLSCHDDRNDACLQLTLGSGLIPSSFVAWWCWGKQRTGSASACHLTIWLFGLVPYKLQTSSQRSKHFRSQLCRLQFQCQREVVVTCSCHLRRTWGQRQWKTSRWSALVPGRVLHARSLWQFRGSDKFHIWFNLVTLSHPESHWTVVLSCTLS